MWPYRCVIDVTFDTRAISEPPTACSMTALIESRAVVAMAETSCRLPLFAETIDPVCQYPEERLRKVSALAVGIRGFFRPKSRPISEPNRNPTREPTKGANTFPNVPNALAIEAPMLPIVPAADAPAPKAQAPAADPMDERIAPSVLVGLSIKEPSFAPRKLPTADGRSPGVQLASLAGSAAVPNKPDPFKP